MHANVFINAFQLDDTYLFHSVGCVASVNDAPNATFVFKTFQCDTFQDSHRFFFNRVKAK